MSSFMVSLGFHPPLFPVKEEEVALPSVQAHVHCCSSVWKAAQAALTHSSAHNQCIADLHRTLTPSYQPGQKVYLSSRDLPLQVESRKLGACYIGPFETERVIHTMTVRPKLPMSLKIHPRVQFLVLYFASSALIESFSSYALDHQHHLPATASPCCAAISQLPPISRLPVPNHPPLLSSTTT